MDCPNLLLGIRYQSQINAIYLAKYFQYKLSKDGHTYILTTATPKTPSTTNKTPHVQLNQCISLCLVRPVPPNNTTHPVLEAMNPLLKEFSDVFQPPMGLPSSSHIDHSIYLITRYALPNSPTYQLAPIEMEEMEKQLTQLINSGHIQPSSSPCTYPTFVIPK